MSLREKAEAATPGPWEVGELRPQGEDTPIVVWNDRGQWVAPVGAGDQARADAEFIATFDPPTVRALLDLLDEFADIIDNITGEDHARARVAELEREGDGRG